jgi:hypothetical protein
MPEIGWGCAVIKALFFASTFILVVLLNELGHVT